MRQVTPTIVLTILAFAAAMAVPPAQAVDLGCGSAAPSATILAIPGSGDAALGWAPDCVTAIAGTTTATDAKVTFTNGDALFHIPVAKGCFTGAQINAGQSWTASLHLVGGHVYNGFTRCDESALQARTGVFLPVKSEGEKLPVIEHNPDGTVTVHVVCAFHGAAMHGRIILTPA